jgi:uncharacterized membrane protein
MHEILGQWERMLTFAVSFLVIGQFWIAHHRMYSHLRRSDQGLLWWNLVSLLTVSFMPFPAALLGNQSLDGDRFPVVFYALSLSLASLAFTGMWLYAVRRRLVEDGDPEVRTFTVRSFGTTGTFLLSIPAAFLGLVPALLCWTVLLPLVRVALLRLRPPGTPSVA